MSWVSVDDLSVGYGARAVLEGVDLAVERGSIVAVLGPSGCGKTTLLRSIAGLLRVSAGSIRIGGREVSPRHRFTYSRRGAASAGCPRKHHCSRI